MQITFFERFEQIPVSDWRRLNTSSCPLVSYEFFKALEASQSVSGARGWQPHHMVIENDGTIDGIMPLYLKQHSWGEYVFDWDWAKAYEDNNLAYYPKLVGTIPFTPVTSNKLWSNKLNLAELFSSLISHCQQHEINSWHILYCPEIDSTSRPTAKGKSGTTDKLPEDVYLRHTVQFHWFNRGYASFDDFLATFTSRKRKNTRKERASIKQQGINIRQVRGPDITASDIDFFYLTYQLTYLKQGHQPHLNFDFFKQIFTHLAANVLLIIARHNDEDVACALFFYDDSHLYGRYWGCKTAFNNLHFELCYYQGIAFCIEHNLQCFNPGTQGEHKIQRGFEPVLTHSYHWVKHGAFKEAIKDFCQHERAHMQRYHQQCQQALPFKVVV
ncbi:GNAT family N-acetyltransferase [Colwellia sp. TT2012]|uniref:GNAT family N-acetyltransferase n=1 Tax=Colwellia sp. TT2012 TaxID=1720342 RepID=UPI00071095AA|nr:GNAT family N-acetyltransferase [Colwellia sp. TT2012]